MTPERFRQIEAVFDAAADAPPGERAAVIDRLCGDDAALRAEVESLLGASPDAPERIQGAIGRQAGRVVEVPRLFAGRFEIERRAGSGGMADVYRARDRDTGAAVALKLTHDDGPEATERFAREARLLAEIEHPGIVSYVAHGQAPDGRRYLAMEWLDGEELAARLARGVLSLAECVELLRRVAEALGAAHRRGVVHRDLKPSNLFLVGGAVAGVKILDFGVARRAVVSLAMTRAGTLVGTPDYMAPEQVRGAREITPAADVFALGCVLHACLTGRPPFVAEHISAVLARILFEDPRPVEKLRPDVPAPLSALLQRMLAKDPSGRPADAGALGAELDALGALAAPALTARRQPSSASAEQGLFSLVVASPPLSASDDADAARRGDVGSALATMGLSADFMADGSLVVKVTGTGSAPDQAARAALAIKERWPAASVALATGRGAVGEVADRAVGLLRQTPVDAAPDAGAGVRMDDLSARLLEARFVLTSSPDGSMLRSEKPDAPPPLSAFDTVKTVSGSARNYPLPVAPRRAPPALVLPARYQDLGLIASGSFGEVRRIRDTVLDRVLAMKLLRAERLETDSHRRRFLAEAEITAQLQHPGIVALYDRGELEDGRLWFTMKEVRGRTLRAVIDELHAASGPEGFGPTPSGWTFRRLVEAFARIAQAVAYAHSREVVHRDLKPDNIMVGEFGEVLVMDWGLARRLDEAEPAGAAGAGGAAGERPLAGAYEESLTHHGDILGTPAYMAPEQAMGDTARHGPWSDVYALGAVLYHLLAGVHPHQRARGDVLVMALLVRPPPRVTQSAGGAPVPPELADVCESAMRRAIAERPSAERLAEDVVAWLDGVRRREQALAQLAQARSFEPEIAAARAQAEVARAGAGALHEALRPSDPIEKKLPAWELEDEAARLARGAALAEARWFSAIQGALSIDPALPEAHAGLAEHYRAALVEAELAHREDDAARFEVLLRAHDRGQHAAFLRGDGALTIDTDPPGAEVIAERYELRRRRLVPEHHAELGRTPLRGAALPRGSYLIRLRAPGRAEVRVPVLIERGGHHDGCPPGSAQPSPIPLPLPGDLGAGEVYVPAGWAWTGGDPDAPDSLPRRRVWIDGFMVGRFPVTNEEYLAFLNDLLGSGREEEALSACPRANLGMLAEADEKLAYDRGPDGRFRLIQRSGGDLWTPRGPAVLMSWRGATAYARWLAARTGRPYRLLNELEREKAARGVDGRLHPWGDYFDATWARCLGSEDREPSRVDVDAYPLDESPHGLRGGAGNSRDWCANLWTHGGPRVESDRLCLDPASDEGDAYRSTRGGAWSSVENHCRAAARFVGRPDTRAATTGVRVARSYP